MLVASGQAALINEPFNRSHPAGVMNAPVRSVYTYVCDENEAEYLAPLRETLAYRYQYWAQFRGHPAMDLPRAARDAIGFLTGRVARRRPLLKDPFALFSVPWFAERLHCNVVVVVRHPLAFVSSLKRLNWSFDFGDLLGQPQLMNRLLSPFRGEMERMQRQPEDVISQASLLWRLIYHTVARYRMTQPRLIVVRHEDLSSHPVEGFRQLYADLGLAFGASAERTVVRSSMEENPTEVSLRDPHAVRLNSRANLENWKHRLSPEEIERVLEATHDIASCFYEDPGRCGPAHLATASDEQSRVRVTL
jgi:Sulfotransferase domain